MKTKREVRNYRGKLGPDRITECRFGRPIFFEVVVRVHARTKEKNFAIQLGKTATAFDRCLTRFA